MATSTLLLCKIGDRIECGGYIGTIKYIGLVEGKPSEWLGIDWDEPGRGKHNGSVNGMQYFTTRLPTSGSLIRPEKVNFGQSAVASIKNRYGQNEDEFTAKINQQKQLLIQQNMNAPFLEMVGFEKVFNKQSNFSSLKIVNLREQNVSSVGCVKELGELCPNIEELDLSKNLLTSWGGIFEICGSLQKLYWLNVSENLLEIPEERQGFSYNHIKTLICSCMNLTWFDVLEIASIFPQIEEFRAPNNQIDRLRPVGNCFQSLRVLDIEGNIIEEWAEICILDSAPNLEQLIIENVGLSSVEFEGSALKVPIFQNLRKLCLVNNFIHQWQSIGELNRLLNLENLKITRNPVLQTDDKETTHQLIIAKIANLKILNGVEIEAKERRGAEYDYLKKYGLVWLKVKGTEHQDAFLQEHNRYLELIDRYGELEESELVVKPTMIKSSLIDLKFNYQDRTVEKKMPPTITVQKLMFLIQKMFRLKDRPQLTYISSSNNDIECELDDELKEIALYCMQNGDQIIVHS